ncbi:MAG: hypothetical protein OEM01_09950 [Desulfobulbaceae bacterium]|nr:hypothetical protein [Desulfobulbaceae bacterium]
MKIDSISIGHFQQRECRTRGSLDAEKRGCADAASFLAAQVTCTVSQINKAWEEKK